MAYTEAQLTAKITALETALARGERNVQFADRAVTYNSPEDIQAQIAYFQRLLTELLGRSRSKQTFATASKGY